jgi:lipopolysaccharide/colanic/teichoic acid biosynthesis glycosyltransferase
MMASPGSQFPRLGVLSAQRLTELLALEVLPAVTVAAMVATRLGAAEAGVALAATLVAAHTLGRSAYAPHLLSVARVSLRAAAPVLGGLATVLFSVLAGKGAMAGPVAVSALGGWIVLMLGLWFKQRFDAARPVRVAVLSSGLAAALAQELRTAGIRGYEVIGWIAADAQAFPHQISGGPERLGELSDVRRLVPEHRIDLLVSCPVHGDERSRLRTLEVVADNCLDLPVRMLELSQLYEDLLGHVPLGTADAAWFQYLLNPRFRPGSAMAKRALDLLVAGALLIASAPVLALAAIAIRLEDGRPVLYRQRRLGKGGTPFTMLKLRSMRVGADAEDGPQWSGERDPRVTAVGRVLRRIHVDELPQLWNVIRGAMTMVGPRPEQPELAPALEERFRYYECRYLLKPGVTGWAQVRCGYAGTEMGSAFKLCHDLFYLKHRSTLSDLLIMVETARMVAGGDQYGVRRADDSFIAESEEQLSNRMIDEEAAAQNA